jgi:hypothetical protein
VYEISRGAAGYLALSFENISASTFFDSGTDTKSIILTSILKETELSSPMVLKEAGVDVARFI